LRLTQVSPETLDGWLGLSESLLQLGREPEADEVLAKVQTRFPDAPEAALLVGRKLLREDKFDEAEATFTRLTGYPDKTRSAAAWSWIAMARLGRGDVAHAVEAAKTALVIDREHAVATYAMGIALRMKNDAAADAWLERSSKLSPRNVAILPRGER
jgi:tetratricopeptide (TPR) repeat protein